MTLNLPVKNSFSILGYETKKIALCNVKKINHIVLDQDDCKISCALLVGGSFFNYETKTIFRTQSLNKHLLPKSNQLKWLKSQRKNICWRYYSILLTLLLYHFVVRWILICLFSLWYLLDIVYICTYIRHTSHIFRQ